jgi:GNAT superfamily N-acetyltransferase
MSATRLAVTIRSARLDDADALADLTTQLGYPANSAAIVQRLGPILASSNDAVLVAADEADRPIGWVHVAVQLALVHSDAGDIGGLVIGEGHRSRGVGQALLERAEAWARERGVSVLQVRSRVTRERAHVFYERLGYERIKTSHVFHKRLA